MNRKQWTILILLALIWGSSFLFIKLAVAEMPVIAVVVGRLMTGLLFLFAALLLTQQGLPRRALWKPLFVMGIINNVIPWSLLVWGQQYMPSGLAAVISATVPFFTVILASTWGDESFSASKVTGLMMGFIGVVILIGADLRDFLTTSSLVVFGEIAVLIMSLSYAIAAVFTRRYLRGESPLHLATGQSTVALLIMLPLLLLPINQPTAIPSAKALLSVTIVGFVGSGMAYILYFLLLEEVGATRTTTVTYLIPIVALFLGWAVLGEAILWPTILGMTLIFAGVGVVNGNLMARVRAYYAYRVAGVSKS